VRTAREEIELTQQATGLNQVQLAAALGVDPSTLRRWLTGRLTMREPEIRLCRALQLAPDIVFVIDAD